MARAHVVVYDIKISSLFGKGHNAVAFLTDQLRDARSLAVTMAPVGGVKKGYISGNLAKGGVPLKLQHGLSGVLRSGPYGARGSLYNSARHALWVHNGTKAIIRGNPTMAVPVAGRRTRMVRVTAVQGQPGNPWLQKAGDITADRYRAKNRYSRYES